MMVTARNAVTLDCHSYIYILTLKLDWLLHFITCNNQSVCAVWSSKSDMNIMLLIQYRVAKETHDSQTSKMVFDGDMDQ